MPRAINARLDARVTIDLDLEDVRTLALALDHLLNAKSQVWVEKTVRDETAGQTVDHFLKQLKKVV